MEAWSLFRRTRSTAWEGWRRRSTVIEAIFQAKSRPEEKSIPVLVAGWPEVRPWRGRPRARELGGRLLARPPDDRDAERPTSPAIGPEGRSASALRITRGAGVAPSGRTACHIVGKSLRRAQPADSGRRDAPWWPDRPCDRRGSSPGGTPRPLSTAPERFLSAPGWSGHDGGRARGVGTPFGLIGR